MQANLVDLLEQILGRLQQSGAVLAIAAFAAIFVFIYKLVTFGQQRKRREIETQLSKYDSEMVAWGVKGIEALSLAHTYVLTDFFGKDARDAMIAKGELQAALSALIDAGRLYFPNRNPDLVGLDRSYAQRGFRPAILDSLMIVHEEMRKLDPAHKQQVADNIFAARRVFVSELREDLDGFRKPKILKQILTADDNWTEIGKLVDAYEMRHGARSFWKERPMTRAELLKVRRDGGAPGAADRSLA